MNAEPSANLATRPVAEDQPSLRAIPLEATDTMPDHILASEQGAANGDNRCGKHWC